MTIMENMKYGSPFIKKGRKIVMKEFIRHLKEKGYEGMRLQEISQY